ncbi:MAG TPA: preprotein translocase subunit YajC [Caulobacteraceae bacterium]|jgi:preprotein translocase subunit YajC
MTLVPALVLAAVAPAAGGSLIDQVGAFAPLLLMVVAAYFLLIRPQQQRARQHTDQVNAIRRGDQVVLSSGTIGKVVRVEDTEVGVEIAQNVTIKVVKSMIADVRSKTEPAAANDKS